MFPLSLSINQHIISDLACAWRNTGGRRVLGTRRLHFESKKESMAAAAAAAIARRLNASGVSGSSNNGLLGGLRLISQQATAAITQVSTDMNMQLKSKVYALEQPLSPFQGAISLCKCFILDGSCILNLFSCPHSLAFAGSAADEA